MTEVANSYVRHNFYTEAMQSADCFFKNSTVPLNCPQNYFSWTEKYQEFLLDGDCTKYTLTLEQDNGGFDIKEVMDFKPFSHCSPIHYGNYSQWIGEGALDYFMTLVRNQAVREGWSFHNSSHIGNQTFPLHQMKDCFDQNSITPKHCPKIDVMKSGQGITFKGDMLKAFVYWTNNFWEGESSYDQVDYQFSIASLIYEDYEEHGTANFVELYDKIKGLVKRAMIKDDVKIGVSSFVLGTLSLAVLAICIGSVCAISNTCCVVTNGCRFDKKDDGNSGEEHDRNSE